MSDIHEAKLSIIKPLKEGRFIFEGIQEGEGKGKNVIIFKPRLEIHYSIWEKIDKETGKECYPEDYPIIGFGEFDFGMTILTPLDLKHNTLINGYEGLSEKSSYEDILMKTIIYDLFHAFCHIKQDPNFSHYHWALYGNLQSRATVTQFD